jgi:hypothetical protein
MYFLALGGGGGGAKVLPPKIGGAKHTLGGRLTLASPSLVLMIL